MIAQIYTFTGGKQQGPFSVAQVNERLRQGFLPPASTLAWYEGCGADWIPIGQVPGIVLDIGSDTSRGAVAMPTNPENQGDGTGGLIPYKNPHALAAYYLGIFGLFPVIGLLFAIPAFILGIMGLKRRKRNPIIKGSVHAWIGIVLGGISIFFHSLVILGIIAANMSSRR